MKNSSKLRKFKFNKKFHPCPFDEGDELFANGIFEFNVTKLLAFIKANPNKFSFEEIEVKSFRLGASQSLDESTVKTANLSIPIILAEIAPDRFNIIDGNHRLEKAHLNGLEKIPACKVGAEQHLAFLTSEKAYKSYIDYWNSKIDDGGG